LREYIILLLHYRTHILESGTETSMNFIAAAFIVLIFSLSSTYGYFYYTTKSNVDSFINSVRPFVNIQYQTFSNTMDGKISIKDVSIQQPSGEEITHIGSIDFILDSALDYI